MRASFTLPTILPKYIFNIFLHGSFGKGQAFVAKK
jgi:hypothetical protein